MKLKLDLHTHCHEASGYVAATPQAVEKILDRLVARGLDGIAITDHYSSRWAYETQAVMAVHFPDTKLIVLAGQEIDVGPRSVVEVFLPNQTTFRFWAHPEFWTVDDRPDVKGIEIDNGMHYINKERVRSIAAERGLLLLRNSDAHYLDDLGRYYNEIEWADLLSLGTSNGTSS